MTILRNTIFMNIYPKMKRKILRKYSTHVLSICCLSLALSFVVFYSKLYATVRRIHQHSDSNQKVNLQNPFKLRGVLSTNKRGFTINGKPFRILSGSFHYFRTEPKQWQDRLLKIKAAGLNTVTTYIPWNIHETYHRQYEFKGKWNIEKFIQLVHKVGLYLIVRPGPYISAEWENGGLPSWVWGDPLMVVRNSSCGPFLAHVENYFSKLLPVLAPFQHKGRGGPIIAFQLENEYGSYGRDPVYMNFIKEQFKKNGLTEMFFTSDIASGLPGGSIENVIAAVNFKESPKVNLIILKNLNPKMPLIVGEFRIGGFDFWTDKHHKTSVLDTIKITDLILSSGVSMNFYMFVGGTNFGFWNGADKKDQYKPVATSYDYNAPITESGDITQKFLAIRTLLQTLKLNKMVLPDVPNNSTKANYGLVKMQHCISYTDMLFHIENIVTLYNPTAMEYLPIHNGSGQAYGYLLYRTTFSKGKILKFLGVVKDRAQVILNGKLIAVLDWFQPQKHVKLQNLEKSNQLDIFVENAGRVNYRYKAVYKAQRKGLLGQVLIDNYEIKNWEHIPFEFDSKFMEVISSSSFWAQSCPRNSLPSLYRGVLMIKSDPRDTFVTMKRWTKGIVFINGVNLGRYWHVGPQQTLYVPYPLLRKGVNSIMVFELHQSFGNVKFLDHPVLDEIVPERNSLDIA